MLLQIIFVFLITLHQSFQEIPIIDTSHPIVIHDEGGNNTLFGYSLAFIKGQFGATVPIFGTLFIGAPKEKRFTQNSGVVWSCQFLIDGNLQCSILSRISNRTTRSGRTRCVKEVALTYPESEAEQFIGLSITATPNELLTCAPRWKRNGYLNASNECVDQTALLGACYKLSYERNGSRPIVSRSGPFDDPDNNGVFRNKYFWYRFAQYGFSSHATRSNNFVVGAPGYTAGDWGNRGHLQIFATGMFVEYPEVNRTSVHYDAQSYTHLGYAITSGRIDSGGEYLAVGAPRGDTFLGSVLVKPYGRQNPRTRLLGEQFGAYFGYSLATSDLNGDGNDELIVGAPFFNLNEGFSSGCIFIFGIDFSYESQNILTKFHLKICLENEAKGARFGSAIASLGDINFDGKEDFVVGAPYHDEGVGSIFIYHGSIPMSSKPAQVIQGRSLNIPNLFGFGTFLLSGNLDVDGNLSPDLAISSFESNHVVILKSRPVAKPNLHLSFHTENSTNELGRIYRFLPSEKQNRIRVRVCISLTLSTGLPLLHSFQLNSTLKFERERIVYFDDGDRDETIYLLNTTEQTCLNRYIGIREEGSNRQTRIQLRVGLSYNAPDIKQNTTTAAILNLSKLQRSNARFTEDLKAFNPFLPALIPITFSNWEGLEIVSGNCDSDGNPECDPELELNIEMNFEDGNGLILNQNNSFVVGQVEAIILRITLYNRHETAYGVTLRVALAFSDDFYLARTEWQWQVNEGSGRIENFRGRPRESNGILNVEDIVRRSRPLQKDSNIVYTVRISNMQQIKVSDCLQGQVYTLVEAFPEGQRDEEKVDEMLEILLKAGLDISILAVLPATGNSEIDPKTQAVDLTQIYIVNNTGYSTIAVGKLKVEIFIPTHAMIQNVFTEVIGIANPSQYSFGLRCRANGFSFRENSLPSPYDESSSKEFESDPENLMAGDEYVPNLQKILSFSEDWITFAGCNENQSSAFCRKITCFTDLPSMGTKTVQIRMQLLSISAATALISEDPAGIRINTSIAVHYLQTVVRKEGESWRKFVVVKRVSLWMIVLAVVVGILVFLLLVFVLFKAGFFRRQAKEQLKDLKRQSMALLKMNDDDL